MKNASLKQYFPLIPTRQELLEEIQANQKQNTIFQGWAPEAQEEFLDFCTGVKGVKTLYDGIFKEVMNPETAPEYLNEFLSLLLGKKVEIIEVLPNDNSRIGDESSLLIMDIGVRLEDGSIADIEIQRLGYAFPGERSACYGADLLLRQYKRVRSQKEEKKFSYRDIKNVYIIVFFEKSPREFFQYPDHYIHFFQQKSDTGLSLPLLQKYFFIPLDIFKESLHNKGIQNRLDGWLTFLSSDNPEDICTLLDRYPDFQDLYEHVYQICRNMENIMGIFSEELLQMDRNTVQYMIDEMQETIDRQKEVLAEKEQALAEKEQALAEKDKALAEKDKELSEIKARIRELEAR